MRRPGPYGECEWCGTEEPARIEEAVMHPYVAQAISAEHTMDLRRRAAQARRSREARQARRGAPDQVRRSVGQSPRPQHRPLSPGRLARGLAATLSEVHYAAYRAAELQTGTKDHRRHAAKAPDTYEDFLRRTSGPARREPAATGRCSGHPVQ